MGILLYLTLCIICTIIIYQNGWHSYMGFVFIFSPIIVAIVGSIDIYDDICYWYNDVNANK